MNLAKPNVSKKVLMTVVVVGILGLLAGSGGTYLALKDRLITENAKPGETTANADPAQPLGSFLESKIPDGTVSPTTIVPKVSEYTGKEVKVRGRIVETGENRYIIVGQETDKPSSMSLNLADSGVDIGKYVSAYTDPNKTAPIPEGQNSPPVVGPATVTGTVSVNKDGFVELTVKKIES